jgi:hypothetical protein
MIFKGLLHPKYYYCDRHIQVVSTILENQAGQDLRGAIIKQDFKGRNQAEEC